MKKLLNLAVALAVATCTGNALAKATPEQAVQLGGSYTPMGGETAANSDGSIPAWDGGITTPPAGYKPGDHHPDPFPEDQPLYTITAENVDQYKELLSHGQQALFNAYPDSFKMLVYPSRRTASYPEYVNQAVKTNAVNAELAANGNGLKYAQIAVPFPFPENGLEAIWNHLSRFRGQALKRWGGQAAPTPSGAYTYVRLDESQLFTYSLEGADAATLSKDNILFKFKQRVTQPARLAGTALLVHEPINQVESPRQAWTYNTGQRRVRKAPNVAYDTPGTASDGLRTTDDFDMFNGSPNRYNWKLVGKKELLVPYNNYMLHSDSVNYDEILKPGHINPELVRYEKHRVWVVEATLKEGINHIYKKRVFHLDEDSWHIVVADMYDNRDQLYRVSLSHLINYYEVPVTFSTLDVYHDLQARRYLALGLDNQEKMYEFNAKLSNKDFTPAALRKEGRR